MGSALAKKLQVLASLALFLIASVSAAAETAPVADEAGQPEVLVAPFPAQADTAEQSVDAPIETDVVALSKELEDLRQRLAALEQQAAPQQKKSIVDSDSDIGQWTDISNEKWTTKLGGHIQLDYITWANADRAIADTDNFFNYRRLRLVADGTGYGQFDFRLQMTLEPGSGSTNNIHATPDIKDAYFTMNDIPIIGRARVGNFFVPFSLEQVTNDTNNIFNERSIPTENVFAAGREIGIAFYNSTADERITWTTGAFFDSISDTIKTRFDDNQGLRLSGRLTWLPYYYEPSEGRHLIHTGIGVLHTNDHDGFVRFSARPQIQRGPILIDSGIIGADSYTTGNIEFASVWGPVAIQAETFLSTIDLDQGSNTNINGSYIHISYFLTGENRVFERFGQHGAQFGRNKPFTNFFAVPGGVGWGAWETKARWSNLNLTNVGRGEYNDFTFGFNWYWSDRTRWMFDWIHPVTSGQTVFGETESDLLAMRFDVNW